MARFPHELRRDGLFTHTWTLVGPLIAGRFSPPKGERPGVYESVTLRLEYRVPTRVRLRIEFQSPFLSRGGDRIHGEVRYGRGPRSVWVQSRGTGEEGVELPVLSAGLLRRRVVVIAPHGKPIVSVQRKSGHFDVDVSGATFGAAERGGGKARLYEAAVVMLLAAKIEQEAQRRATAAGMAAGATAAGAAAGAAHARRRRQERE